MTKVEKVLTQEQVKKLGLNKVSIIIADILNGYTSIGDFAFCDCKQLTSVTIPNSVTSIGTAAFMGCSITSIELPNSVTRIGDFAFSGCSYLTTITIPNSVTSIEYQCFYRCIRLTSVIIPDSITSIGGDCFAYCRSLTSIKIPDSVTHIGNYAFHGCINLNSVTIKDKTYEKQPIINGKCKAYKGFNANMTCRGFQYKEGKTFKINGKPELCKWGFHACLNLIDVFDYYCGNLGKNIVVHEVELEGISDERRDDSKIVAKKITIRKRLL